jgi:hypothetical protein
MNPFHEFVELVRSARTCGLPSSTCLKHLRDLYFVCLLVCTGLVAIGLAMEVGEIWQDAREAIWEESLALEHWLRLSIDRNEYPARLSRWKRLFAVVGWVLIVVGVVGEGVFEGLVHKYDLVLSVMSESSIAETQKETAQLQVENTKLLALIQPRSISVDEQRAIGASLSQFKGQKVLITVINPADPESYNFSQQVIGALRVGKLDAMEDDPNGSAVAVRGTGVQVRWQNANQKRCAELIAEALGGLGHVKKVTLVRGEPEFRAMHTVDIPVTIGISIRPKPFDVAH